MSGLGSLDVATQDDFDVEPVAGLPEALPEGERILWSDAPDWRAMLVDVFHLRALLIYAAIFLAWRGLATVYDGGGLLDVLAATGTLAAVFALGFALLAVLALLTAKNTRYTVTNRRVAMRIGVALTMTINLPYKQVLSADYRAAPFGTGSIALTLSQTGGLGYLVLWPHARPLRFSRPQPMLRCIRDAEKVAQCLANALKATHAGIEAPSIHVAGPARRGAAVAA